MVYRFDLTALPLVAKVYEVTRRTVWQIADPHHILLYISAGSCTVELNGKVFCLNEGDFLFIPENSLYLRQPNNNELCTMFYAHFSLNGFEMSEKQSREELLSQKEQTDIALLRDAPLSSFPKKLYILQKVSVPQQHKKVCDLFSEALAGASNALFQRPVRMSVIISYILMLISEASAEKLFNGNIPLSSGEIPEKLHRAVEYIHQHYTEKISLESLCRFCAISKQQMIRYFHSALGTTPTAYIMQYKINKARELFMNAPSMSIKEVSAELGFDDQCYFSRIFTRHTGETPTNYRTRIERFDEDRHIAEATYGQKNTDSF